MFSASPLVCAGGFFLYPLLFAWYSKIMAKSWQTNNVRRMYNPVHTYIHVTVATSTNYQYLLPDSSCGYIHVLS